MRLPISVPDRCYTFTICRQDFRSAIAYIQAFLLQIASDSADFERIIELCGYVRPCALVLQAKYTHEVSIWFRSDSEGTSKGFNLTCTAIKESKNQTIYGIFGRQ